MRFVYALGRRGYFDGSGWGAASDAGAGASDGDAPGFTHFRPRFPPAGTFVSQT